MGLLFSTIGIAASDFFCINLSTISEILGMSESMAGVTFLAFGNGSPDVFSTFAAMSTHSGSLAVGELIGAAGFITAVVAGSMALVREFKVGKKTFVRDVGFFTVAASFSMVFLADGSLHLWECCVMIGFYLFYVATVVTWHWYLTRRRRQRERNALARGHYIAANSEEIEVSEEYHDDEDTPAAERQSFRERSVEDFEALEGGTRSVGDGYESDGDGDRGRHLAAQMADSMRLVRPQGTRRNTINPIRPSLVGALEFRSVLSTLQKSRNMHGRPIHLRRYSDDPTAPSSEQAIASSTNSILRADDENGDILPSIETSHPGQLGVPVSRARAVSMNDATGPTPQNPAAYTVANIPEIGIMAATPTYPRHLTVPTHGLASSHSPATGDPGLGSSLIAPPSPTISLSPPPSDVGSRDVSPAPPLDRPKYDSRLAPGDGVPGARHLRNDFFAGHSSHLSDSPTESPMSGSPRRPQLIIPQSQNGSRGRSSSPASEFPKYTDSPLPISAHGSSRTPSLLLPNAELSPESSYVLDETDCSSPKPVRWWPYKVLPPPEVLLATLFPTLYTWKDKSIWDKFLSVISAPPIFILVITLPVVEPASKDEEKNDESTEEAQNLVARRMSSVALRVTPGSPNGDLDEEPEWLQYRRSTLNADRRNTLSPSHGLSRRSTSDTGMTGSDSLRNRSPLPAPAAKLPTGHEAPLEAAGDAVLDTDSPSSPRDWNRWLVAVQLFTAPLFVVFILWASTSDDLNMKHLLQLVLYALIGSLVAFAILLLTTSPDKPPKYRFLLCFLGFVVSISWISTIANEVVGVLKAFGVILGISDAILGLTIFAVGNSLGDLVADITVARLGFPVMALSACFGGPMLNLLLGIGISGAYITITDSNHKHHKHPGRPRKYKPYQIEVSPTLMISGITLLVTLLGLLIAVPLNKWVMSRKIGYGLITLWSISTVLNVVVEVTGIFGDMAL